MDSRTICGKMRALIIRSPCTIPVVPDPSTNTCKWLNKRSCENNLRKNCRSNNTRISVAHNTSHFEKQPNSHHQTLRQRQYLCRPVCVEFESHHPSD